MEPLWQALQQSAFAGLVRQSELIYPAANVLHVIGVMTFFALVAVIDLQILTASGNARLIRKLRPWAFAMLIVVAATGFTLFAADAVAVAGNPVFRLKLLMIVLAAANFAVHMTSTSVAVSRATAILSLFAWLIVAALGRSIAYA